MTQPHLDQGSEKKPPPLSEADILRAMETLKGYVDLTPQDFEALFKKVYEFSYQRLLREHTAETIMAKPVFTIRENSTVGDCIRLLAEKRIAGVPVVDDSGMLVGVISEKDILCRLGKNPQMHLMQLIDDSIRQPLQPPPSLLQTCVADVMSAPAVNAEPETSFGDLARIFGRHAINRLPITDRDGKVAGMVTRADMIRAISGLI